MKKICIVSYCNIYLLPYATTYIENITNNGSVCSLLFWDRDAANGENDIYPDCNKMFYQKKLTRESTQMDKVSGYLGASRFIRNTIQKEQYDGLIFLQTHVAIACTDILQKKYKKKYIIDIRDWTLENLSFYKVLEKKCIDNSYVTVISSPAYKNFLPEHNYIVAHNYTPFTGQEVKQIREYHKQKTVLPINISFVGTVRFLDMNKKILKLFANDMRFNINFFGNGSEALEKYCKTNGIKNTKFYGRFSPDQTANFYKQTDLINNLYGNHDKSLDYALSNKLYHSGQLYIPILVCPDTYMEEVVRNYNMGYVFDVNDIKAVDKLFAWYQEYDRRAMKIGCNKFIKEVRMQNDDFITNIQKFING